MISTKLQGRWRLSSWNFKIPCQASLHAPGEPGTEKTKVSFIRPAQALDWIVEVPTFSYEI
jgi:hypothetical protein